MKLSRVAILVLVTAIASAGITRYFFPQNIEVEKDIVHNDVRTIVKTITKADGTTEKTEETIDKSIKDDSSTKKTAVVKNQWMFDVGARANPTNLTVFYDVQAQRRILGPFFLGAKVSTDKTVGVSIGMEF